MGVWLVLTASLTAGIAAPFLLNDHQMHLLASRLRVEHSERCPLCGMTTSFIAISAGRMNDARAANESGPLVFCLFTGNQVAFTLAALRRNRKQKREGVKCRNSA